MEVQVRNIGAAFPGTTKFVVFNYEAGDASTEAPRSSDRADAAPTDGTFTSTAFPT